MYVLWIDWLKNSRRFDSTAIFLENKKPCRVRAGRIVLERFSIRKTQCANFIPNIF